MLTLSCKQRPDLVTALPRQMLLRAMFQVSSALCPISLPRTVDVDIGPIYCVSAGRGARERRIRQEASPTGAFSDFLPALICTTSLPQEYPILS